MTHRFEIGERVTYPEKRFPMATWTIELVVVEQLRGAEGPEYPLQDQHRGTEYLLAEHELDP